MTQVQKGKSGKKKKKRQPSIYLALWYLCPPQQVLGVLFHTCGLGAHHRHIPTCTLVLLHCINQLGYPDRIVPLMSYCTVQWQVGHPSCQWSWTDKRFRALQNLGMSNTWAATVVAITGLWFPSIQWSKVLKRVIERLEDNFSLFITNRLCRE